MSEAIAPLKLAPEKKSQHHPASTGPGRPSSLSYLNVNEVQDPVIGQQIASTEQHIYENYPFIGLLLQKKDRYYRITTTFTKTNPGTINEVEENFGPGEYKIRFTAPNNEEIELPFTIKGEVAAEAPVKDSASLDYETSHLQARISSLETRILNRDNELDDAYLKIRKLNNDLLDQERLIKERYEGELEKLKSENETLKQKNIELDRKIFELTLDAKYSDKGSSSVWEKFYELIKDIPANDILEVVMQRLPSSKSHIPQLPENRLNPAPEQSQELNDTQAMSDPQTLTQNVVNKIFEIGTQALTVTNPDLAGVKNAIDTALAQYAQQGYQLDPQNWIIIAKSLVQFTIEQGISNERLAEVITPVLENVKMAKSALEFVPVKGAIAMLEKNFPMNLSDIERTVLTEVLTIFKKKLS